MNLIQVFVEVLLVASGLFFLSTALLDGRRFPQRVGAPSTAQHGGAARGRVMLLPRTIRQTALD